MIGVWIMSKVFNSARVLIPGVNFRHKIQDQPILRQTLIKMTLAIIPGPGYEAILFDFFKNNI